MAKKKLIFVSCGQQTATEISLGRQVKETIDSTSEFEAYFAETVHDLESLTKNIFDALYRCSGAIIFLHDRGKVIDSSGNEWGNRSSVWVNQEIAILAFRKYIDASELPTLVFKQDNIRIEGAMTSLISNPLQLIDPLYVINEIKNWLKSKSFALSSAEIFEDQWKLLSKSSIEIISCLIEQGGKDVKVEVIRRDLMTRHGFTNNDTTDAIRNAKIDFSKTNLVKYKHDIYSGDEFSMHPTWVFYIHRAIAEWQKKKD
jgi:hypothetical protein